MPHTLFIVIFVHQPLVYVIINMYNARDAADFDTLPSYYDVCLCLVYFCCFFNYYEYLCFCRKTTKLFVSGGNASFCCIFFLGNWRLYCTSITSHVNSIESINLFIHIDLHLVRYYMTVSTPNITNSPIRSRLFPRMYLHLTMLFWLCHKAV